MANLISPGYNRSTLISQTLAPVEERCLEFKGLNKRKVVEEGEMSDMKNLTSDDYPVLSPRKPRGEMELPTGVVLPLRIMARYEKIALIARDDEDQINFYFDGVKVPEVDDLTYDSQYEDMLLPTEDMHLRTSDSYISEHRSRQLQKP